MRSCVNSQEALVGLPQTSVVDPSGYVGFYDLKESPFCPTPNPRFVFPSQTFAIASIRLKQALRRRGSPILITGESGTGKTTLYRYVLHLARPALLSVIVDPFLGPDELLKQVAHDFGVRPGDK